MKKLFYWAGTTVFLLTACDSPSPHNEAAARQAEAVEARMDAEAARMVAAADSVRAADERIIDSLQALKTPAAQSQSRRTAPTLHRKR